MLRNPVMFVVLTGSLVTGVVAVRDLIVGGPDVGFTLQLALWLWFTVLFANFAEAMAEGRGKAQADAMRGTRLSRAPNVCGIRPTTSTSSRSSRRSSGVGTMSSSSPAISCRQTARSSKASPPWTNRRSRASPRR